MNFITLLSVAMGGTLNAATADMINLGIMDQILDKHGITMDGFYRLAKPYQAPVQP
jgi:hypothetical protein